MTTGDTRDRGSTGGAAMSRKALLVCGVLSSLLYVGIDQLAAIRHAGYHDFASQTISELDAASSGPGRASASVPANARSERPAPEAPSPSPTRTRDSATPT